MTPELTALALAGLLQVAQFVILAVPANLQHGSKVMMGTRDTPPQLTGVVARLNRAFINHNEGLILFGIAVMVVTLGGKASAFTAACAWAYLVARALYVPCYAFGLTPWRSVVWLVGFLASTLMLVAALV